MKKEIQDFLLAFSLSALAFSTVWAKILHNPWYYDYPGFEYDPLSLPVTFFWMVIWTAFLWLIRRNSERHYIGLLWNGLFTLSCLMAINGLRQEIGFTRASYGNGPVFLTCGILAIFLAAFLIKNPSKTRKALERGIIVLSPFAFFIVIRVASELFFSNSYVPPIAEIKKREERIGPRIVWMIFDEFDIRPSFERRGDHKYPFLDQFKDESLVATQARAAGPSTTPSIASMVSGRNLTDMHLTSEHELQFFDQDRKESVLWRDVETIFSKGEKRGLHCAIIGNYLPYQKIFGAHCSYVLPSCKEEQDLFSHFSRLSHYLYYKLLLDGIPFLRSWGYSQEPLIRKEFIDAFLHMRRHSLRAASNPEIDFLFIHWPIPHHPGIYSSQTREFHPDFPATYLDNLHLVDETVGQIREAMKQTNLWDESLVIITSDHPLRKFNFKLPFGKLPAFSEEELQAPYFRVPFLIKWPHQLTPIVYEGPFRLTEIHSLLESTMAGEIRSPEGLVTWLQSKLDRLALP